MDETKTKILYELLVTSGGGFVFAKDYVSKRAAEKRGEKMVHDLTEEARLGGFDLDYAYKVRKMEIHDG